jgi:hypothetical protein
MTDKYIMRFKLLTLIDITATGARRGDDYMQVKQQQNYLTVMQTIGIRSNPEILNPPKRQTIDVSTSGFGSDHTGEHTVWSLDFNFGLNQSHNLDMLASDFDLVPVIGGLDETVSVEDWVFRTTDTQLRNIVFTLIEE